MHGEKGTMSAERLGLIKKDWKLLETKGNSNLPYLAIDLGSNLELNGFAYKPQSGKGFKRGVAKGVVKVSDDGQNWKTLENFEFGNLVNDPSKRYHYFKKATSARYVRIDITEMAQEGELTIADFDLL